MRQTNEWICLFKDKVTCPISFNSAQIISANTAWVHHMLCSRNCVFSNLTWSILRIPNLAISRVLLAETRAPFTLEFSVSTGQSLWQPLPHALSSLTIQSSPPSRRLSPVSPLLICKADTIFHSFSKAMSMKGQLLMANHFYLNAKEVPRGLQPKEGPLKAGFLCACSVAQSYLTLWPYGLCPADSSAHGISQARILQWVAVSFFRESSPPWGWTRASCIERQILYHWALWETLELDLTQHIGHTSQSKLTIPSVVSSEMLLLSPCNLHGPGAHLRDFSSLMVQGVTGNIPNQFFTLTGNETSIHFTLWTKNVTCHISKKKILRPSSQLTVPVEGIQDDAKRNIGDLDN